MSSINLRTLFSLTFLCFVVLLTASITLLISNKSSSDIEAEIGDSIAGIAYQMADKLDFFMWSRYSEVELVSEMNLFKESTNLEEIRNVMNQLNDSIPSFSWIGLTDEQGNIKAATDDLLVNESIAKRPVFKEAIEQPFVGDVHEAVMLAELLPNPTGEPLEFVDISFPIYDDKNQFKGVLATHLSWSWSKEIERTIIKPYKSSLDHARKMDVFIIRPGDQQIILGPENLIGTTAPELLISEDNWKVVTWPDGEKYVTGYSTSDGYLTYPGLDWRILVRVPVEQAFISVTHLQEYILLVGVFSAVLFAILGWMIAGKIADPLHEISRAANKLKKGENVEIPHFRLIKDLDILSFSLREMVKTIIQTKSELGEMKRLAHKDSLTGLPNRIALYSYINHKLENESLNERYLFLFLDLDGFKDINDTYGHQAGDHLLKVVSSRLQELVKTEGLAARLGGDEFILMKKSTTMNSTKEGEVIGQSIIAAINRPISLNEETEVIIRCSVGGAIWPDYSIEPDEVIQLADEALYVSKNKGKNQFTFYTK
ncbi:sensor domain-containing diguanylate cyclase [Bacillus weihaiensis]|uniref:sensor domain-containing diguanylate cyclase n=1 Tax=Bacillus weihaiensis TaxID=1547283 RepID=UPI002355DF22|nr:sensor domain-containing diguanylate cyclase [Bacillus weihaiensis]